MFIQRATERHVLAKRSNIVYRYVRPFDHVWPNDQTFLIFDGKQCLNVSPLRHVTKHSSKRKNKLNLLHHGFEAFQNIFSFVKANLFETGMICDYAKLSNISHLRQTMFIRFATSQNITRKASGAQYSILEALSKYFQLLKSKKIFCGNVCEVAKLSVRHLTSSTNNATSQNIAQQARISYIFAKCSWST